VYYSHKHNHQSITVTDTITSLLQSQSPAYYSHRHNHQSITVTITITSLLQSQSQSPVYYSHRHNHLSITQSPQDFAGLFCDSCGLKFLISRELFQKVQMKVAVFLGVCCEFSSL